MLLHFQLHLKHMYLHSGILSISTVHPRELFVVCCMFLQRLPSRRMLP